MYLPVLISNTARFITLCTFCFVFSLSYCWFACIYWTLRFTFRVLISLLPLLYFVWRISLPVMAASASSIDVIRVLVIDGNNQIFTDSCVCPLFSSSADMHGSFFAFVGHGKNHKDAASVRATYPIPAACGIYYFEVKIVSKGRDGYAHVAPFKIFLVSWFHNVLYMQCLPNWADHGPASGVCLKITCSYCLAAFFNYISYISMCKFICLINNHNYFNLEHIFDSFCLF